mmetsp:Transcript_22322/g.44798  ORF Transcript_22322/g.44798 Transcript_22322/m.44798 type:complete len:251 (+) Transcript_22322:173-925(+)
MSPFLLEEFLTCSGSDDIAVHIAAEHAPFALIELALIFARLLKILFPEQVSEQVDVEQVHRHGDDPVMRRDITVQSVGIEVHRNSNAKKHLYVLNRGHEDGEEARLHFDRGKEVPQVHHRVNKGVQQGEELARCREMDEVKPGVPRGDQVMDVVKTADRLFGDDEESGVDELEEFRIAEEVDPRHLASVIVVLWDRVEEGHKSSFGFNTVIVCEVRDTGEDVIIFFHYLRRVFVSRRSNSSQGQKAKRPD